MSNKLNSTVATMGIDTTTSMSATAAAFPESSHGRTLSGSPLDVRAD
jgi:hypothetical protein